MTSNTRVLFLALLFVTLVAAYHVVAPFLAGLTWAIVLVAAFRPLHARLVRVLGGRQRVASAVLTLIVAAFVVAPILSAAVAAVQGGIAAIQWTVAQYHAGATELGLDDRWPWIADAIERVRALPGLATVDVKAMAISALEQIGRFIAAEGPALLGGALGTAFSFGIMLLAMPMLFANWDRWSRSLAEALPIPTADATRIIADLTQMTRSVFMSTGLTAATQAILGGLALFVLGVPYAVTLTAVMFFSALVPGGTALVWAPAAIWLAMNGHTWQAVVLAGWGAGVVSTIDNVLRPIFAGRGVSLPGGALFFGMFGGMLAFGLVGLFLGPIVLYMTRELFAVLRREQVAEASPDPVAGGR